MTDHLQDFKAFLARFRAAINAYDAKQALGCYSRDYHGLYGYSLDKTEHYRRRDVDWPGVFKQYAGQNPRWEAEDVEFIPMGEDGMLVRSWNSFYLQDELAARFFGVQAFRREGGEWKLLREYAEYWASPAPSPALRQSPPPETEHEW